MFTKTLAIVMRKSDRKVLAHKFGYPGYTWWRLPGGGVEKGESLEQTVVRELSEEAGLEEVVLVRQVGVLRYDSQMDGKPRERFCFLVYAPDGLPERWDYVVQGDGDDANMVFEHFWIGSDEFDKVDPTLRPILTPEYIPELFG